MKKVVERRRREHRARMSGVVETLRRVLVPLLMPVVSLVPDVVVLCALVGASLLTATIASSASVEFLGWSWLTPELALAGYYFASTVVYGAAATVFYFVVRGAAPWAVLAPLLLSCLGLWASLTFDAMLRGADTAEVREAAADPAEAQRRMLYLHGAAAGVVGLALSLIPLACPLALEVDARRAERPRGAGAP
jgi:hypothetical protein